MITIERKELRNGVLIPLIGLGTYIQSREFGHIPDTIEKAIELGYRSIDTAAGYGSEEVVGQAVAAARIPREQLFITTKIRNEDQGYKEAIASIEKSTKSLGTYIDMLLIHWPCPMKGKYLDTWKAMQEMYAKKMLRGIGVSNFTIAHLEALKKAGGELPMVNQIEMHPYFVQKDMLAYCAENDILVEAWSPFLRDGSILNDPDVREVAEHNKRTPAQVILRYLVQLGAGVIVKASSGDHLAQNANIFDFCLDEEDFSRMEALNRGKRIWQDPDEYCD